MRDRSNRSTHHGSLGEHSCRLQHEHVHVEQDHVSQQDLIQLQGYQHRVQHGQYEKQMEQQMKCHRLSQLI